MDKIFSTRVDESIIHRIRSLAHRLHTSNKKIVENAIEMYAARIDSEEDSDVFEQTCGAWRRKESAARIVAKARTAFRNSMEKGQP